MRWALLPLLCAVSACSAEDRQSGNVLLASAGNDKAEASQRVMEPERCLRTDGDYYRLKLNGDCIELLPRRRMVGVWILGNEESSFIPGPPKVPAADDRMRLRIYLDSQGVDRVAATGAEGVRYPAVFAVEFVGRRSKVPGLYYTGPGDHLVVVDRLISARFIGKAPEADFATALKAGRQFDSSKLSRPLPDSIWD